jgi:hypothetical protein
LIGDEQLLSPIQFIGERKGTLTAIVAAKFYHADIRVKSRRVHKEAERYLREYQQRDSWPA